MTLGESAHAAERDEFWMLRALAEAERGRGRVEPNPLVGAVVVRDDRPIAFGHHDRFGGPHAEVVALSHAGAEARGSTLFVTLEPCCHTGKTPPCADAIQAAGIRRVVAALTDPFPKVAGGGLARLRASGIEVKVGVAAEPARRLNAPYFKRQATGRPFVLAKWAMTLDGKIATADGDSRWISGPRSRAHVHELRGRTDAIVIGIGTALADDPTLTARPPGPRVAVRLVLDGAARLPISSRLVQSAREAPVWVAVSDRAPAERRAALEAHGCEVIAFAEPGPVPIGPLLDELGRRGLTNLLIEGGGRVIGAFLDADEVDAVEVYLAPILEGGDHPQTPARGRGLARMAEALRLEGLQFDVLDGDVRIRGRLPRPWLGSGAPGIGEINSRP